MSDTLPAEPVVLPPDGDLSSPTSELVVGDFIQARRTDPDEPVEVAEGVVSAVAAGVVTMGTRTFAHTDGWRFELIRRPLVFPATLTEIAATLTDGQTVHLIGRGAFWTTDNGTRVEPDAIRSFDVVDPA